MKSGLAKLVALATIVSCAIAPISANAQSHSAKSRHRQATKNTWRNIAIGSGALGILGLVEHNNTLAIAGIAGAAYSASRYEHDRRSQSKIDRRRAAFYSHSVVYMHGHRYRRHAYWSHGHEYYKFVRG